MSPRVAALLLAAGLQIIAVATLLRPAPPLNPALAARWVSRLDGDGDGVLSVSELQARSLPGTPGWDLDDDGSVSPGELERMLWMLSPNVLYESSDRRRRITWLPGD
jgi:hypothetical protein